MQTQRLFTPLRSFAMNHCRGTCRRFVVSSARAMIRVIRALHATIFHFWHECNSQVPRNMQIIIQKEICTHKKFYCIKYKGIVLLAYRVL